MGRGLIDVRSLFSEKGDRVSPFLFTFVLVLTSGLLIPTFAAHSAEAETAYKSTVYRRPLGNEPPTLDPARISDIYSFAVTQQVFDGLVQFDQTLTIAPGLAQFWKASRDGLIWTFTLRNGIKFHHGREVTAEDVVYSLTRILDARTKSGAADLLSNIKGAHEFREGRAKTVVGIVALDDRTIQITLDEASVPLVSVLAVGHAKVVPRDLAEQQGEAFGLHPIGTGPFKFVYWTRGKEIALSANSDYFAGAPRLSRVIYKIFPGEQFDSMYEEFRRGNLEDTPIPTKDYRRIMAETGHIYVKRPMMSVRFYGMNTRLRPFTDRRIRQALVHAIDREALVQEVTLGRFTVARGILPLGTQGFNPSLRGYAYDPQRARDLLREAGYPEGRGLPPITIWSSVKTAGVLQEHEHMKRYLKEIDVQSDFRYLTDWPSFSMNLREGKFGIFLYAWFADVPDPDNFLFKLFHSKSPRNFFGYVSPVVDGLLNAARNARAPQHRVDLYRRAEQAVMDDAPLIPIFHYTYERLFQPYVRSVEVNGLGDPYIPLRKIWLDRK